MSRPINDGYTIVPDWTLEFERFADSLGVPKDAVKFELSKDWAFQFHEPGQLRVTKADGTTVDIDVKFAVLERIADALGVTGKAASFTLTRDYRENRHAIFTVSSWVMPEMMDSLEQSIEGVAE